jgi:hypothetical protein
VRSSYALRIVCLAALAVGLCVPVTSANADFTPFTLISGSQTIESDFAAEPVISANGGYVAYVGSQEGQRGIWRKNLKTGQLDLVAAGDANAPSISADGRFISFTTTATDPSTGDGSQCPSVYVRDMGLEESSPPAPPTPGVFTLASALDGGSAPIQYAAGCPNGGAAAAPRVAISGDGNEVAFTVDAQSNLMTPGTITTPPAQIAVRVINARRTLLVSQTMTSVGGTPQPVPGGAALTDGSPGEDTAGQDLTFADPDSTAAISADGSTVAWQGINIPQQAPAADADSATLHPFDYSEPLWRRIVDGPGAPIRRVTGGDDPVGPCPSGCAGPLDTLWLNPAAAPVPGQETGPSRGTLITGSSFGAATPFGDTPGSMPLEDATPQLSSSGQQVAILSTQPSAGQDPSCGTNGGCGASLQTTNAFIVNMAAGLSRAAALTRLTQWAADNFDQTSIANVSLSASIDDIAISPEGDRVAFTTSRTVFPFSPPALITPQLSPVANEQLYVADIPDATLQVATIGYDGQPADGPVSSPSFSANNGPIAFASQAANLAFGALSDESGGSEVFTTSELKPPAVRGSTVIGPVPHPKISPDWRISATARRARGGSIVVSVSVPGPGRLSAKADAGVPAGVLSAHRGQARRRSGRGVAHSSRRRRRVVTVSIARAVTAPKRAGIVNLRLRPAARYEALVARHHGLYATVTVMFAVVGHPVLTETLPVDFVLGRRSGHGGRRPARRHGTATGRRS